LTRVVKGDQERRADGGESRQLSGHQPERVLRVRAGQYLDRDELRVGRKPIRAVGEVDHAVVAGAQEMDEAVVGDALTIGREACVGSGHGCLLSCSAL
jgi:hypothetical protein